MTAEIGGIENQNDGIGTGNTGAQALEDIVGDLLVFRPRGQTVETGQIDQISLPSVGKLQATCALLDGDAGEVGHFLAKAR